MSKRKRQEKSKLWVAALALSMALGAQALVRAEEAPAAAPAAGTQQASAEAEAKSPFSFGLEYMATTDFADKVSPRLYRHDVSATAAYDIKNWFEAGVEVDYFFKTVGKFYSRYPEDSGVNSVSPTISRVILKDMRFLGGKHKLAAAAVGDVPANQEARIEGYKGSLGLMPVLTSSFFDGLLVLKNRLSYSFIFNRYEFSPTSFDPSSTANYGYDTGASVKIIGGLRAGVGFGVRRTRYTDGFHDFNYKNTQTLSYSWKSWSVALKHTNGGYTDDGRVDLWYVDKYRRLLSGSLGYEF